MTYKSLLFGSIGTIIETSELQRESFNEAFKEAGLYWYWDQEDYRLLLKQSGGTKRIEDFAEKNNTTVEAKKIREKKTHIFNQKLMTEKLMPREGVIDAAAAIDSTKSVIVVSILKYCIIAGTIVCD